MSLGHSITQQQIAPALENTRARLLSLARPQGPWSGHLSSSALSTAVAVAALSWMDYAAHQHLIRSGLQWLVRHQNTDGGWGDTPTSPSNPSTTLLCWAAFNRDPQVMREFPSALERAEECLAKHFGRVDPANLANRVLAIYGNDRTFSVPILTLCALCGRLGDGPNAWAHIPQLPFELAAVPHQCFKWLRLPVVSYAIPALIAIGLARHENTGGLNHPLRLLRNRLKSRVLRILHATQPTSGGFLEAVPLTAFVTMALAASGLKNHPVAQDGCQFLVKAVRANGSWPIDINLSTWVTTLAINALAAQGPLPFPSEHQNALEHWLLAQQHQQSHPFTHAAPGGWAWTDLPGGVPDADDTAGALLALWHLEHGKRIGGTVRDQSFPGATNAAHRGIQWLLDLQNRDGGLPTFCRGWSKLPFDRSCPDLTAHALAAWNVWLPTLPPESRRPVHLATYHALQYLRQNQRADGAWIPLWFGNQYAPAKENPIYGTARVLLALAQLPPPLNTAAEAMVRKGRQWLIQSQQRNGGWGCNANLPPAIEETALAMDALIRAGVRERAILEPGARWLLEATQSGAVFNPSPIGLYFAALWYAEDLYPLIFTCSALGSLARIMPAA